MTKAKKLQADYKIESVPALTEGRFLTSPTQASGAPQSLAVAEALIDQVRRKA